MVLRLENEWLAALNTANVNVIAEILADDFARPAPDAGHFVKKADLLAYYRSHLPPKSPKKRRFDDINVTVYGTTALVRGTVTTRSVEGGVIARLLFTDVFVLRDGKWQAVSAQENAATIPRMQAHRDHPGGKGPRGQ